MSPEFLIMYKVVLHTHLLLYIYIYTLMFQLQIKFRLTYVVISGKSEVEKKCLCNPMYVEFWICHLMTAFQFCV
jgi:hypothetical protein